MALRDRAFDIPDPCLRAATGLPHVSMTEAVSAIHGRGTPSLIEGDMNQLES